ncbi:DUF3105 domain-containing protein [Blastococcus sp. CCUG 61487]|uniref:DUF3105 domain-containing protein n=1 Tax=Blastococcus sp. CCUG 61487 TaxID=1840703 RepID=UPI0010C037AF|nr:DUF3105 domain-containing protein [Blastococcus sp. CCUG 61487]TKJ29298.1 hypothetical protein A6V29_02250 [Blastococcus sp. CCUG 61487]
MAKDRKPDDGRARGSATRSGAGGSTGRAKAGGKGGRTRPPTQAVADAQKRPWALIAGAIAVVVFAVGAIGLAVWQVNEAEAGKVSSVDEIAGIETWEGLSQEHVTTPVDYEQSPPVGGPHDPEWADCTGTVYDVEIRPENAVHSLEHGAVWITYDPEVVSDADIETLERLADEPGRMLSPYAGQDSPISIQSWGHQLKVDSAVDERLEQFADLLTFAANLEPGATCSNPRFIEQPRLAGEGSAGTPEATDMGEPPSDGS